MNGSEEILKGYDALPGEERESLVSGRNEDPRVSLSIVGKRLEVVENSSLFFSLIATALGICYLIYMLGLPTSVGAFLMGVFAIFMLFFFAMMLATLVIGMPLEALLKYLVKLTPRYKFYAAVADSIAKHQSSLRVERQQREAAEQEHRNSRLKKERENFDRLIDHCASKNPMFVPQSLFDFSVPELADAAIEHCEAALARKNGDERQRKESLDWYRRLTFLLHLIEDDDTVRLESAAANIVELLATECLTETTVTKLVGELALINKSERIQKSRVDRITRKYLEKFDAHFDVKPDATLLSNSDK